MIVFNTTFHLEDDIHENGIRFLKEIYIPTAADSGFLFEPRLARIYAQHEEEGVSYSLQFRVKNTETLNHWLSSDGQKLQSEIGKCFGNKMLGFITLMEEVNL